jgi:hypothetical protein
MHNFCNEVYSLTGGVTMTSVRLQPGDRISLRLCYLGLPIGTGGTITHVYVKETDLYRVRFDTRAHGIPIYRNYFDYIAEQRNERNAV